MRIVLKEGWDYYTNLAQAATRWNQVGAAFDVNLVAPGLGGEGQCLEIAGQVGYELQYAFEPAQKITMHFGIMPTIRTGTSLEWIKMQTAFGGHQWSLGWDAAGHLVVYGEGGAVLGASNTVLTTNLAHRICMSADTTPGSMHFRCSINGNNDTGLQLDGIDLQDDPSINTTGLLVLGRASGSPGQNGYRIDDIVVGIDECVDWGPLEINTMVPTADVLAQWTRSAGADNFANVDETLENDDTDYNSTSTLTQKDIFDFSNPPHTPQSILGVQLVNIARKEESATRKMREVIRIGATDYPGTEHTLVEQYAQYVSTWMLNPATGMPWTAAELNLLQGGYEYTADA